VPSLQLYASLPPLRVAALLPPEPSPPLPDVLLPLAVSAALPAASVVPLELQVSSSSYQLLLLQVLAPLLLPVLRSQPLLAQPVLSSSSWPVIRLSVLTPNT